MSNRLKFYKLEKAVDLANQYHDAWRHDSGLPYIFHPMEVCKDGSNRGILDEELLCAFVLHDMLEDTTYSEGQMLADFGPRVLQIVKEVSKIGIDDQGIDVKMDFLKQCPTKSLDSLLLKLSDRYCNVCDYKMGKRDWYPGYYALQAYPMVHHFDNNFQNIKDMFGEKVASNYNSLVVELVNVVFSQYHIVMSNKNEENIKIMDNLLVNRAKGKYEQKRDNSR